MSGPDIVDDREAMHRERSRRYAEALAKAAAADEQIKALTEQLAEAEYLRRIAEDEAGAASWINDDGSDPWRSNVDTHVYHAGEPEPPDNRNFLLSLSSGVIFIAARHRKTEHNPNPVRYGWARLEYGESSHHYGDWSSVLEHAPLLAFTQDTDYGLDQLSRVISQHVADETELRRRLPRKSDGDAWNAGTLPERLTTLENKHLDEIVQAHAERDAATRERREVEFLAQRMADALDSQDTEQSRLALEAWNQRAAVQP